MSSWQGGRLLGHCSLPGICLRIVCRSLVLGAQCTAAALLVTPQGAAVDISACRPGCSPPCSYVVPLVFFHYRRHWTTLRDDCATADNRGIVSLSLSLPVAGPDASAATMRTANGSAHSGGDSSKLGPSASSRARESAMEAATVDEAGKAAVGLAAEAPVTLDIELGARTSSAHAGSSQPGSPVRSALSTLADLQRRMAQGAAAARPGSGGGVHRRTESQEPVLSQEDHNGSSLG